MTTETRCDLVFITGLLVVLVGAGVYGSRPGLGFGLAVLGGLLGAGATSTLVRHKDRRRERELRERGEEGLPEVRRLGK